MRKGFSALLLALGLVSVTACSTDLEVYAPAKEIRSVYCILNPNDTVQYVRVAKAFQVEGDAISYAAQNDLSVSGLQVKLTGDGKIWTATQVDDFPRNDGGFPATHTVYKFTTDGSGPGRDTLAHDQEYSLDVGAPDADDYVTGTTQLPARPRIRGVFSLVAGAGTTQCLPRLSLDRKFNFFWRKAGGNASYEVRVGLEYQANGEEKFIQYGPDDLITENNRCNEGAGSICVQFAEKELLRRFVQGMPEDPFITYTYDTGDSCVLSNNDLHLLPTSLWFEVTAVDEYLGNYMIVNDPKVSDVSGTKPEYTNLRGNIDVVGIFGSYNADRKYAILNVCSEALLGLNGSLQVGSCSWD